MYCQIAFLCHPQRLPPGGGVSAAFIVLILSLTQVLGKYAFRINFDAPPKNHQPRMISVYFAGGDDSHSHTLGTWHPQNKHSD